MAASALAALLLAAVPTAALDVTPRTGTVGDPLEARLTVELPEGFDLERGPVGPELGSDAAVLEGAWQPASPGGRAVWTGKVAAYRTGRVEIPALTLALRTPAGPITVRTDPVVLEITSVLKPEDREKGATPEIAELKPPASIPPDWGPLRRALAGLLLLTACAALAFWLYRRFAPRLSAAREPVDPFRRLPPHEWAYEELRRLLASRLAEEGGADRFFEELARIAKMYLGARYRVDLMECTTPEAARALDQAGAEREALRRARALLERADRIKFAREGASLADCRAAVDEAYAVVDATKVEARPAAPEAGAA